MEEQGPGKEFDCEKRARLIAAIQDLLQDHPTSSALWACLWLADVPRLEKLVEDASVPAEIGNPNLTFDGLISFKFRNIVLSWSQRNRVTPTTPNQSTSPTGTSSALHRLAAINQAAPHTKDAGEGTEQATLAPQTPPRPTKRRRVSSRSPSPSTSDRSRSATAAQDCRSRDGNRCIITKAYDPIDVAHIYPYSMRNVVVGGSNSSFWNLLSFFWTEPHIRSWYASVFPRGTEVVSNLLCLAPQMHRYHERALFALQPINLSEDKKCMTLRFYWLPKRNFSNSVNLSDPPTIPSNLSGLGQEHKAWHIQTEKKISSGDKIIMETDDPDNFPLPDWNLMDMQWILQRLASLSAAADILHEDYDDDDSSGIEWGDDLSCGQWEEEDELVRIRRSVGSSDQEVENQELFTPSPEIQKFTAAPKRLYVPSTHC
ncbi:hypothetical protein MaudCBS49596_006918 [Microsporum audouinii]